jgi:hypothetical protein
MKDLSTMQGCLGLVILVFGSMFLGALAIKLITQGHL